MTHADPPPGATGLPLATRLLRRLSNWSARSLFTGFLAWFLVWTVLALLVVDLASTPTREEELGRLAGPLIPALGALFAFVTSFTVANDWSQHRDAERTTGLEAGAALRLAWASQSPGLDGHRIRHALTAYLRSVVDEEWSTLPDGPGGSDRTAALLGDLERTVREIAGDPATRNAVASDLLSTSASVAVTRRDRLSLAGHDLPVPLFALSFLSGVALALTTVCLASTIDQWTTLVIAGVVVVIALDLALVVSISAPYRGDIAVGPDPIVHVLGELDSGMFGPVDRP